MTDKQIIIDGVDVSGCPYYIDSDGSCSSHDCECVKCVHNVCLYKDYKAKEQECEELYKWLPIVTRLEEQFKSHEKAKGISYKTYTEQVFTELNQLKAELQEIREEFRIETLYWKDPNERPHRTHRSLKFLKLKQALTEIKEIAEKAAEESGVFKEYFKRNNYSWKQHQLRALTCKYNIILQKCEVIDEN